MNLSLKIRKLKTTKNQNLIRYHSPKSLHLYLSRSLNWTCKMKTP